MTFIADLYVVMTNWFALIEGRARVGYMRSSGFTFYFYMFLY